MCLLREKGNGDRARRSPGGAQYLTKKLAIVKTKHNRPQRASIGTCRVELATFPAEELFAAGRPRHDLPAARAERSYTWSLQEAA